MDIFLYITLLNSHTSCMRQPLFRSSQVVANSKHGIRLTRISISALSLLCHFRLVSLFFPKWRVFLIIIIKDEGTETLSLKALQQVCASVEYES